MHTPSLHQVPASATAAPAALIQRLLSVIACNAVAFLALFWSLPVLQRHAPDLDTWLVVLVAVALANFARELLEGLVLALRALLHR